MLLNEEQKRRYTAFWDRTPTDRACLYISARDSAPAFDPPISLEQQWEDPAYRLKAALYETEHTAYFAEGFPSVFANFGPGSLAACLGGTYRLAPATVWFDSVISEWDTPKTLAIDKNSKMFRLIREYYDLFLQKTDRFYASLTDMGGSYDIIASLRGTEDLLYDMYDYPDEIKAFSEQITKVWREYYTAEVQNLLRKQDGVTSWMPIWSDKTYYPLQCDYSAMLSPAMFGEFILPGLRAQTEMMERSIYHLDGVGEIPHLDQILSLPRLNAVQWVPGAGKPDYTDPCWFDLYHHIQAAGKGIVLFFPSLDGLETLFKHVSQRGMYLWLAVHDEKEAKEIVDMAKKLNF